MQRSSNESALHHGLPQKALTLWDGNPQTLQLLGDTRNLVYRFEHPPSGQGRILRLTPPGHRSRPASKRSLISSLT